MWVKVCGLGHVGDLKWAQVGIWHRRWPGAQVACSTSPRPQYLRWAQVVIWHRRWPGAQVAAPLPDTSGGLRWAIGTVGGQVLRWPAPPLPFPAPQVSSGGHLAPQVAWCSGGPPPLPPLPPRHLRWAQVGN